VEGSDTRQHKPLYEVLYDPSEMKMQEGNVDVKPNKVPLDSEHSEVLLKG